MFYKLVTIANNEDPYIFINYTKEFPSLLDYY